MLPKQFLLNTQGQKMLAADRNKYSKMQKQIQPRTHMHTHAKLQESADMFIRRPHTHERVCM